MSQGSRSLGEPAHERRMFSAIRWQLVAWNVLVLILIFAVLDAGVFVILTQSVYGRVDDMLLRSGQQVARTAFFRDAMRPPAFPIRVAGLQSEGLFYLILDERGVVIINPQDVPVEDLANNTEPLTQALAGNEDLRTLRLSSGERVRMYTVALHGEGGRVTGILQIGRPLASEEHALQILQWLFLAGGLLGIFLSAVGGLFLAERALVPIRMAFRRQQDFVADASHELRTPLTLIRANAEMAARHPEQALSVTGAQLQDILSETDRLNGLVGDLLTLARADAGREQLELTALPLNELVRDTARQYVPLAEKRGVTMSIDAEAPVTVQGDVTRLRQLLVILLDNAIKYTPAGGRVTVRTADGKGQTLEGGLHSPLARRQRYAVLTVADTGAGIAPEHVPHIFERFYRADKARSHDGGAGLGLAIAQWIVTAHDGRIQVQSELGRGTTFSVLLPVDIKATC